jgi:hypothetical protein
MTVAVAAKYPWGVLKELIPKGISVPESIILVSDSRFSTKMPTGYTTKSDSGTKLFQLGKDVACVYAGVCVLGEKCIDELRFRLSRQKNPNSVNSLKIAHDTFNRVYRHEVAIRKFDPKETVLFLLVGVCNRQGKGELYRFSHDEDFKPIPIEGYYVLGFPETTTRFVELLSNQLKISVEKELSLRKQYPQIPMAQMSPMPIADGQVLIMMTAILSRIVEQGPDTTIGGKIQSALITAKGVSYNDVSYSGNPASPNAEWTKVTADYASLKTITHISGTIGVYHSSI